MTESELYQGREQTLIKHFIFEKYLQRFAHIVGSRWSSITYVDCFSGPWNSRSQDFNDTSFVIALHELRNARETLAKKNKDLKIRCFFIEKDPLAYQQLKQFVEKIHDADIETFPGEFENAIREISKFIKQGGPSTFPFVFIDPTGWSGYPMRLLAPLMQFEHVELMINFQTYFISRFIESPNEVTRDEFAELFGSPEVKEKVEGLSRADREEVLVSAYCENLSKKGQFRYICQAVVPRPQVNRTHFHLIYATRHPKGAEVFKEAEKNSIPLMHEARAKAQMRRRRERTGMDELFEMYDPKYVDDLRKRYLTKASNLVLEMLRVNEKVPYDDVWASIIGFPLVWESDLKDWIHEWISSDKKKVKIEGLEPKERVPKLGRNVVLVRQY